MLNLDVFVQYIAPKRLLSWLAGMLAESKIKWWKNFLIRFFIKRYSVDLTCARVEDYREYPSFNAFFIRQLKLNARPIVAHPKMVACPADGCISQIGEIKRDLLFQAKRFYFNLNDLLGGEETLKKTFYNGYFATIYLAPKDYHRVHMPLAGELKETIYIPGKLFSVNQKTTLHVPQLFARNERLVCIYDTMAGPMAVILIGAMLVGSMHTVWPLESHPARITKKFYENMVRLDKGAEMGHFKMGSTVIILFAKDTIQWNLAFHAQSTVKMGESIGNVLI